MPKKTEPLTVEELDLIREALEVFAKDAMPPDMRDESAALMSWLKDPEPDPRKFMERKQLEIDAYRLVMRDRVALLIAKLIPLKDKALAREMMDGLEKEH